MAFDSSSLDRLLGRGEVRLALAGVLVACLALGYRGREPARRPLPPTGPEPESAEGGAAAAVHDPAAHNENGRGRLARSPREIDAQGWKDILWRVFNEIGNDRLLAVAAGVTFYALLAIFPAIGAFVSLYGLVNDPATVEQHLQLLYGVIPSGGVEIIGEQLKRVSVQGGGALGFGFVFGLGVALWSANAGVKALFDALNVVYNERETRSFVKLNLVALTFTFGAIIFLGLTISAMIVVPIAIEFVGLTNATEGWLQFLRWPLMLLVSCGAIAVLYRYGPSRERAKWRWVTWGSLIAGAAWLGVSGGFSWYVANFGSYNETYGSLGAAIGFMTWIWISSAIILIGAEINAEMEHQTRHDTTTGPDLPQGDRGAVVADTLGASYR